MVSAASGTDCANGGVAVTDGYGNTDYACNGVTGPAGADGTNGVSPTVGTEPAGANCAHGGANITDAAGDVAYACNGAPGPAGPAGTTGQTGGNVYGSTALAVSPDQGLTLIPGLAETITVPANSFAYVSTEGGVETESEATDGFSATGIYLAVDGVPLYERSGTLDGAQLVEPANNGTLTSAVADWSMSAVVPVSAGTYTFQVAAEGAGSGDTAEVSGGTNSYNEGTLSVLILGD